MSLLRYVAAAALSACGAWAAQAPNPIPPAGVSTRALPNGGLVVVRRDASAPLCVVDLWIRAGATDDGGTGAAHAVEHMVFKGSTPGIDDALEAAGIVAYAATLADATHYLATAPADKAPLVARTLCRVLNAPRIDPAAWELERRVMLEESERSRTDAVAEVRRALSARLFGSVYGAPVAGSPEALKALGGAGIAAFHRRWYRADRAILVVAGNVDAAAAMDGAVAALSAVKAEGDSPKDIPVPAAVGPVEAAVIRDDGSAAGLAWPVDGADAAALEVLCEVLRSRLPGRMGGVARVVSVSHPWQRAALLAIVAQGSFTDGEPVIAALRKAVAAATLGITASDVAAAARRSRWSWWLDHETPAEQGRALGLGAALGDVQRASLEPERLNAVTLADVREAAERLTGPPASAPR
jgi:predicted Zn-dependent peptidase